MLIIIATPSCPALVLVSIAENLLSYGLVLRFDPIRRVFIIPVGGGVRYKTTGGNIINCGNELIMVLDCSVIF